MVNRRGLIAALWVAGIVVSSYAQQPKYPRPPVASVPSGPQPGASKSDPSLSKPDPSSEGEGQVPTFRSDVKLVNVFVSVQDPNGAPVATLKQQDFRIFEDGVPQKIAVFSRESELPLSIVVAIDTSLSTKKDLKLELESARKFAHAILRPVDSMALYQFCEKVYQLVPFTSDLARIDNGINRVQHGSATALYDAIYLGSHALARRDGRKVMVVITDGGDTMSQVNYQEALRSAQVSEAIVYSIIVVPIEESAGRDIGGEHALVQMSTDTGGKYYYASGLSALDRAFRQISDELRTQYLLAYYPSPRSTSNDFRRIEVKISDAFPGAGELRPRHRAGYYTSKDE
ncbi:MAG TPA: VWA domain-containing protein [Terriglobales bacterium]|nr:VWA domain-containing protein [Terriglobales bacterium]